MRQEESIENYRIKGPDQETSTRTREVYLFSIFTKRLKNDIRPIVRMMKPVPLP